MYGLSDEEIAAIREGQFEAFAPADLALLRMADAMADTPSNISDELFQELRRHFSEEQLIEFAATAALAQDSNVSYPCARGSWELRNVAAVARSAPAMRRGFAPP